MRSLIIEAFGSPGVGKSHVVEHLLSHVARQGGRVQREPYPLDRGARMSRVCRKVWLMSVQLPGLLPSIPAAMRLMRQCEWASRAGALKALLNWVMMMASLRHLQRCKEPILLSQGAFQAIWSLAYRARPETDFPLHCWLDLTLAILKGRKLVVLLVTARATTVAHRLDSRADGQSILDRQRDDHAMDRSQRIIDELTGLINAQTNRGHVRIVVHDNNADGFSDRTAARLERELGLQAADPERISGAQG
jgi:hypothetical protein